MARVGAPAEIQALVRRFADNRADYESDAYNETQLRREFLDPFLRALGWDVDNAAGYAEAYKDVVHEASIRIDGSPKAPDYCCRIGGTRKFFVEAKKPAVNLADDRAPAYQLRRYAWSADLPLSVLSNFKAFCVYDGRIPPRATDRASTARAMIVGFEEYDERWDEIAAVFSREAVLRGAFDRFAITPRRRGTAPVDAFFLRQIEAWREQLAADLVRRNRRLSQHQLNFAVQATLDRLVFLRICEDRGLEEYGTLRDIAPRRGVYRRLLHLFELADARYNSGLFHFQHEAGRGTPDHLTPGLSIGDEALRDIVEHLYFPKSPYEFSVVSGEILGQVYEQFLGKIIRLLPGGEIRVEEKPETRRAGGVYYTPAYIVRFIVERAVEPALAGRRPEDFIRGGQRRRRLRIVDPACGSGSFLIIAYQHLLDWYLERYSADDPLRWARGRAPRIVQASGGDWRLTTAERKRILLDHIFGVDIDPQAVEVTKLSLLLKVLEGEARETLQLAMRVLHERALPDLDANIRCGNSLVGVDVLDALPDLDEEDVFRINPFDWNAEFPDAMGAGGFDAVIGNPPYVYRNATETVLRPYYSEHYESAQGNADLYKFFLERGLGLTARGGRLGFIVSASFLVQTTFSRLRSFVLANSQIEHLAPLGPGAFRSATIDSAVVVARKDRPDPAQAIAVRAPSRPTRLPGIRPYAIPQGRFARNPEHVFDYRLTEAEGAPIVARLTHDFPVIESGFEFGVGINTGYIRAELTAETRIDERYHPMVPGNGISRYGPVNTDGFIMYDPAFVRSQGEHGRTLPQEHLLSEPKILVVRTRNLSLPERIVATLDRTGAYNLNRLSNIVAREGRSLSGLLGVLNSTLYRWLFSTRYYDYEIKPVYLRNSPLPDTEDAVLVRATEQMLALTARAKDAPTAGETERLQRRIVAAEHQVDEAVWRLFGIADDERAHILAQLASFAARDEDLDTEDFALTRIGAERQERQAA